MSNSPIAPLTTIAPILCLLLHPASSKYGTRPSSSIPTYHTRLFYQTFSRTSAISNLTFPTSTETITSVKFNQSEPSVLASIGTDRTFTLYDIRTGKAERRVVMQFRSNALSWCPTHPTTLLLASEDHNLYTFDIRHMATPTQIYKAHVAAVMSCEWSPTGLEFVSGGWDRNVRLWKKDKGTGEDVFHTKRMGRVSSTVFTNDGRFLVSGSDDGNVRVWKANASEKLGVVNARERAAIEYRAKLVDRWKMDKQVGKIARYVSGSFEADIANFSTERDIFPNLCTRLPISSGRCWRRRGSRTSAGGNIREKAKTSQSQRARRLSLWNRHDFCLLW